MKKVNSQAWYVYGTQGLPPSGSSGSDVSICFGELILKQTSFFFFLVVVAPSKFMLKCILTYTIQFDKKGSLVLFYVYESFADMCMYMYMYTTCMQYL